MRSEESFYNEEKMRRRVNPGPYTTRYFEMGLISQGDKVCDVGCGTGSDVNYLVKQGVDTVGYDNEMLAPMISIGKELFGDDLPIYNADARDLPVDSDSMDVLIFSTVLHFFKNEEFGKVLDEAERIAKPGARLVVYEFSDKSTNPYLRHVMDDHGSTPSEYVLGMLIERGYELLDIKEFTHDNGKIFYSAAFRIPEG